MRPVQSLVRKFLNKKLESSWDSGFLYGAFSGSFAMMYVNRTRQEKHTIPQHTGDDCIYCKEYSQSKNMSLK